MFGQVKVGMIQGLFDADPLIGIKGQQSLEQMLEPLVVLGVGLRRVDRIVERLHAFDVLSALTIGRAVGKVQTTGAKVVGPIGLCFAPKVVRHRAKDGLHHGQVLEIVVRLEERFAGVELDQDASDRPGVARVGPAHLQDDLRRTIVTRGHDLRVVLLVERCTAKVDQPDISVLQHPFLARIGAPCDRHQIVVAVDQEDVLRL